MTQEAGEFGDHEDDGRDQGRDQGWDGGCPPEEAAPGGDGCGEPLGPCPGHGMPPPFAALSPDVMLDAVERLGLPVDGRLIALNSYENRVYQIGVDDERFGPFVVVKFYRPGRWSDAAILEEHGWVSELAAEELPVVPPLQLGGGSLHTHAGFRYGVFPRQGGRAAEFDDDENLARMGRLLGRIHGVGQRKPFLHRPCLDIETFGEASLAWLERSGMLPLEQASAYLSLGRQALAASAQCWAWAGKPQSLRLHGDCHSGNVLWTDQGPHFVDFDDSRQGPAIQDLWMLLSGEPDRRIRQLTILIQAYRQFADFNLAELHLVEALRTLRLIHHAAWLARRWDDPAFPVAFPWFASPHYWQERILELREQLVLLAEPPLFPDF